MYASLSYLALSQLSAKILDEIDNLFIGGVNMDVLIFECSGMKNGEKFPVENTGRGQDISPEFIIKNLSSCAKTLAITLEDIKHPLFKDFTHWLIWNIPASEKIEASIPGGKAVPGLGNARQGDWLRLV